MIQVCDPPRTRQVRRLSTEEFCQLVRGEVSCVYRPRSEVLRMLEGTHPDGLACPQHIAIAHTLVRAWALEGEQP